MTIELANFQRMAVQSLLESMETSVREIILKSPTGSGKTIILTHFMAEYLAGHTNTVFIWLTPGKGGLELQSQYKMNLYIRNVRTKLLDDVMTCGFQADDCCFINWEKLTKKGNNALKEGERINFLEWVEKALDAGLRFKVVIDESHQNFTEKSDAIVRLFKTDKIIRCSATPIPNRQAKLIEISEKEVIAEGLIKKMLYINENFPQVIQTEDKTAYLLERALVRRQELRAALAGIGKSINPLVIVQLPNNSDALIEHVEEFFAGKGITVAAGTLAVWLSGRHENIEGISEPNATPMAVVIKQAVATGWDCPRAYILVKLRENMDETFEVQTIGRIRRMPEAKHYENDLLDSCYLYTFDSKFTEGVKMSLGKSALDARTLTLRDTYKKITLVKEQRTSVTDMRDPRSALAAVCQYCRSAFSLTGDKIKNKTRLASEGFVFVDYILRNTLSGKVVTLSELAGENDLNKLIVEEPLNTHAHGREFHHRVGKIGLELGLKYEYMNAILGKLFGDRNPYGGKLLALSPKDLYAFVINNSIRLSEICQEAMAAPLQQMAFKPKAISEKPFTIPQSVLFTYDSAGKVQGISDKNVYEGYLLSAEPRSSSEKKFEKFCDKCKAVDWWYKNGDKGEIYLSIVYVDNSGHQRLFYPDYVVSVRGEIWIMETKGGFTRSGASEDCDQFSPKKFEVLKSYLARHNLQGGFVRLDKQSDELCICTDTLSDDIRSDAWQLLGEILA